MAVTDWREYGAQVHAQEEAKRKANAEYAIFGLGSLGMCYERGLGVEKNLEAAAHYYHKSAEDGDATAQNNYGRCCEKGIGREKDLKEAF
eukprot:8509845-Pyramimonas_sp.AAC.1